MRLYLDPATRTFLAVAPAGATTLPPQAAGALQLDVSDDAWRATYQPAYQAAAQAGLDLIVNQDGTTRTAAHVPSLQEQARSTLQSFRSNQSPTQADLVTALRAAAVLLS